MQNTQNELRQFNRTDKIAVKQCRAGSVFLREYENITISDHDMSVLELGMFQVWVTERPDDGEERFFVKSCYDLS